MENTIVSQGFEQTIILDNSLEIVPIKEIDYRDKPIDKTANFFNSFRGKIEGNEELRVDVSGGYYKHRNFLEYLELAYNHHYGIVIRPDDFWYIILTEIASQIKQTPDNYRSLFTTAEEGKTEIIIQNGDPVNMNFNTLINALKEVVPTNVDVFLPTFSTSTPLSKLAFYASFADMVSPYYNYSMLLCGISKVKVLGSPEEYDKMWSALVKLVGIFKDDEVLQPYLTQSLNVFSEIVRSVKKPDAKFWKEIFTLKKCGSGSEVMVNGWITKLFIKQPRVQYVENYPSQVSVVSYTNLDTGKKYKKYAGLFGSRIENEFLVPEYGYFVNEVIESEKEKNKEEKSLEETIISKGKEFIPPSLLK